MSVHAGILGVGLAVPDRILTNVDLEQMVDTSDEWIVSRTGIRERHICGPGEFTSTLGTAAARRALESAGKRAEDVDLIVCATTSGDYPWPATACLIQNELGATRAAAFDLSAACSGFVYALEAGAGFVRGGMGCVLVIGADTLTRQVDWEDRTTCVLFGDGAGAAVLGPCGSDEGLLSSALGSDGSGAEHIVLRAGGTRHPITEDVVARKWNHIQMRGAEVFKFAVRKMGDACDEALKRAGLTTDDVSLFVPHQANLRIIVGAAERMGLPAEKVFVNVDRYGNTSAASIPIALAEAVKERRLHRGDIVVFVGFGAGLTWGAAVMRWVRDD